MLKKLLTLLFASVIAIPLATSAFAQEAPTETKEARWEGRVIRSNPENSTLSVRKVGASNDERTVQYDSSTKWVSQYHGDNKTSDIDASQVKDGDFVICKGTWEKGSVLHATLISKRLAHSN
jgi:Ni/Co efflux regulator RcnB